VASTVTPYLLSEMTSFSKQIGFGLPRARRNRKSPKSYYRTCFWNRQKMASFPTNVTIKH
ncbi:hypothetical protein SESBI_30561, partial [Sesbania bispinosa]